jgi:hypothetical protein
MEDTNTIIVKSCSKCSEEKSIDKFIPNRNICKDCRNRQSKESYHSFDVQSDIQKVCSTCNVEKPIKDFIKFRIICKDCNNEKRCSKYRENEEHRLKIIQKSTDYKHEKVVKKRIEKELETKIIEEQIGEENKICKYCCEVHPKTHYRHNRLKCKDCERDEPSSKFRRITRTRIFNALQKKDKHTIEYLGCSSDEFTKWMLDNGNGFTIENHGKEWHIDHVIPLSKFDLDNEEEQLIAFNWRNTMPLKPKENLSKNNKIIQLQVEQHLKHLLEFHTLNNLNLPQKYIDLFAKHLVVREVP